MRYTRHALRRIRQRLGLSRREAIDLLERSRRRWLFAGDGYGGASRWAVQYAADGRTSLVVFVLDFEGNLVLTVYRTMAKRKAKALPNPSVLTEQETLRTRVAELERSANAKAGIAADMVKQRDAALAEAEQLRGELDASQGELTASERARATSNAARVEADAEADGLEDRLTKSLELNLNLVRESDEWTQVLERSDTSLGKWALAACIGWAFALVACIALALGQ